MSKIAEQDGQPEARAAFVAAAAIMGSSRRVRAFWLQTPAARPGLEVEEKDAADNLAGASTRNRKRVDAAIAHHAKTDKRAG
jgi:hypothetical protein